MSNKLLPIYLTPKTYHIDEVVVIPYKNFNEFKEAFVNLKIQDTICDKINMSIYLSVEELRSYAPPPGLLRGKITAFASLFDKRIQDKRKYELLLKHDEYEIFLATKFNPQLIKQITPLKDNSKVEDFMMFCDFTNEFIENANNYEIIDNINKCYKEFVLIFLHL